MRVHSIDAIPIDIPLTRNFGGSTYAVLKRSTVITRLATDDGVVSEVYNGDNREHGVEIARLIREELAPRVRGVDVRDRERIWATLFALSHASRDRKTLLEAHKLWQETGNIHATRSNVLVLGAASLEQGELHLSAISSSR